MSNSRPQNFDKAEITGSTIGFRFHAYDEELEEVQLSQDNPNNKSDKEKTDNLTPGSLDGAKAVVDNETVVDSIRDQWSLLGKRSISVDSAYESPFSNPIETWKKLNVLKEKIAKTVEEKIHEMKIDRNASSHSKLIHSKENLSISDSEDTSESSKISEQWVDTDNQNSSCDQTIDENPDINLSTSDSQMLENIKEGESKEEKNELRSRKRFSNLSDLINFSDIKIATAKNDIEENTIDSSFGDDVESGVEADERLDGTEEDSLDLFDSETFVLGPVGGQRSQNPPGGNSPFQNFLGIFISLITPKSSTVGFLLGFTVYFFLPLPDFFRGFLLSLLLIIFWGTVKGHFCNDETSQHQRSFSIPNYKSMPPLKVPESKPCKGIWFNEYEKEVYNPDYYSVTQTVPAYLELENSTLKISRPKGKVSRRATYDEPEYKFQIISERIYNINGCNVYLMPDGLTRKRLFSKKYPIVIYLKPDSLLSEKKNGKEVEDKESEEGSQTEENLITAEASKNKSVLYLFARCDRQKEEWYRRLLSASRLHTFSIDQKNEKIPDTVEDTENKAEKTSLSGSSSKEASTPFETLFFDDEVNQLEEYIHYMAKVMDVEIIPQESKVRSHFWSRKQKMKKKDSELQEENEEVYNMKNSINSECKKPSSESSNNIKGSEEKEHREIRNCNQVLWFSAFINRILFDVFRSPYWLEKIQNKIQKKLNSIRLPYYIEDIEVTEMDLGKNGPIFHRASLPYMNDSGLWFDMDVTFDGLIKLTIQTHLNLIKLQQGIEESEKSETMFSEKQKKKEGKKKHKIEKESQDSFLIKESKEKIKKSTDQLNETYPETSVKPSSARVIQEFFSSHELNSEKLVNKPSEYSAKKYIEEVKHLAEIAVKENLSKNKAKGSDQVVDTPTPNSEKKRSAIYDSDLEDSAESSDEDEETEPTFHPVVNDNQDSTPKRYPRTRRSSKKIFQVFENVARSKYFRTVAQSKYVQKAIAGVSAAKLRLTIEIKSCTGILAVNIPPPPSDRFWYGFREMPTLVFSVNPKIGDKTVRFVHIKSYLQKKILHELKARIVQPNMISVVCTPLLREEFTPRFNNVPHFTQTCGKKVMVTPNMIDFVLPTSAPARSSSFLNIEEQDTHEATLSE